MCTIQLNDILSSGLNLPDAGNQLYEMVKQQSECNERIIIDMTDVTSLSSVFLNTSIGRIIDEKGIDYLKKNISFIKITRQQAERLTEYLSKYKH